MNILIIRFSALGDVAMTAPVIREFAALHPEDTFTVLSKPFCAPLFASLGSNVRFIGADVKGEYKGFRGIWKLFRHLHAMHFDCICDLHDVLRTKVLRKFFRLYGYRVYSIDKERADRKLITAPEGKKQLKQLTTGFEKYRRVLNLPLPLPRRGDSAHTEGSVVDSNPPSLGGVGGGFGGGSIPPSLGGVGGGFGIAPFAAHQGKIYPLDKMERVIELLITERPHCRIILFGGGGKEREKMQEWARRFAGNVEVAADLVKGMAEELQLMKSLTCMVSMDSANMHLASLVGTRVVSIWGATHPYAGFLGWQQSPDDCVQVNLPCRPCSIYGNKPCLRKDMACMNQITPEEIVKKITTPPLPCGHLPLEGGE